MTISSSILIPSLKPRDLIEYIIEGLAQVHAAGALYDDPSPSGPTMFMSLSRASMMPSV